MTRLRAIFYGLGRAFHGVGRRPLISMLSIGAISVALLLVGLVALAAGNVERMTARFGRGVQMIIYLQDGVTPERAMAIADILAKVQAVEHVDYVPPDEAYKRLQETLGPRRDLLDGIEPGFLPASLEVKLADGVRELAAASPLVARRRVTPRRRRGRISRRLGRASDLAPRGPARGRRGARAPRRDGVRLRRRRDDQARHVRPSRGARDPAPRRRHRWLRALAAGRRGGVARHGRRGGGVRPPWRSSSGWLPRPRATLAGAFGEIHLAFLPQGIVLGGMAAGLVLGVIGSWPRWGKMCSGSVAVIALTASLGGLTLALAKDDRLLQLAIRN